MAHTSLSIRAVLPEASLLVYTKYGIQAANTSGPAQDILVLIALRSSDGLYEHKLFHSPIRAFPSRIHKVWYSRIMVLIASASSDGSYAQSCQSLPFSHTQCLYSSYKHKWASTKDSGTYRTQEQRWLMRA